MRPYLIEIDQRTTNSTLNKMSAYNANGLQAESIFIQIKVHRANRETVEESSVLHCFTRLAEVLKIVGHNSALRSLTIACSGELFDLADAKQIHKSLHSLQRGDGSKLTNLTLSWGGIKPNDKAKLKKVQDLLKNIPAYFTSLNLGTALSPISHGVLLAVLKTIPTTITSLDLMGNAIGSSVSGSEQLKILINAIPAKKLNFLGLGNNRLFYNVTDPKEKISIINCALAKASTVDLSGNTLCKDIKSQKAFMDFLNKIRSQSEARTIILRGSELKLAKMLLLPEETTINEVAQIIITIPAQENTATITIRNSEELPDYTITISPSTEEAGLVSKIQTNVKSRTTPTLGANTTTVWRPTAAGSDTAGPAPADEKLRDATTMATAAPGATGPT